MSALSLPQIEDSVQQLSLPEQVELMAWLARTIQQQTVSSQEVVDDELIAMANDPDIQRELASFRQNSLERKRMDWVVYSANPAW